jgi:hypothetical protein
LGKLEMLPDSSSSDMESFAFSVVEFRLILFRVEVLLFNVKLLLLVFSKVTACIRSVISIINNINIILRISRLTLISSFILVFFHFWRISE